MLQATGTEALTDSADSTVTDSTDSTVTDSTDPTVTDSADPTVTDSTDPTLTDSADPTITDSTHPSVTDSTQCLALTAGVPTIHNCNHQAQCSTPLLSTLYSVQYTSTVTLVLNAVH